MDQIKIGKFIADCRKAQNLTQMQLAEKLNVTDRAVSKWETGKSMPDSAIMLALCGILKITVNDLLSGEKIMMDNYNKQLEENLLAMVKEKEESDKRLLRAEIVTGVVCIVPLLSAVILTAVLPMQEWLSGLLVGLGVLPLLIATPFMLKIEQMAGYYQCQNCGHKHVPKYSNVFLAMHLGRTRYMPCPKCHKKSWQKKVISKE